MMLADCARERSHPPWCLASDAQFSDQGLIPLVALAFQVAQQAFAATKHFQEALLRRKIVFVGL